MGYLDYNNINEAAGSNFSITKNGTDVVFTYQELSHYSDSRYVEQMCSPLTGSYSNALVVGLGVGVIPQWLANEKSCSVDVVDNDSELINEVNTQSYLNSNISLIEGDLTSYTPTGSYDLIVLDIWWDHTEITQDLQNTLKARYTGSLTTEGTLYIPLLK